MTLTLPEDKELRILLLVSENDIEQKFGNDLKSYAEKHHLDYNTILEEEAIKNLYGYQYVFNI